MSRHNKRCKKKEKKKDMQCFYVFNPYLDLACNVILFGRCHACYAWLWPDKRTRLAREERRFVIDAIQRIVSSHLLTSSRKLISARPKDCNISGPCFCPRRRHRCQMMLCGAAVSFTSGAVSGATVRLHDNSISMVGAWQCRRIPSSSFDFWSSISVCLLVFCFFLAFTFYWF